MNMQSALAAFEKSDSVLKLKETLLTVAKSYGFSGFNFLDIAKLPYEIPLYGGLSGKAWEEDYEQFQSCNVDPALARARRTNATFSWGNIKISHPEDTNGKSEEILELSKLQSHLDGLIVPYHFIDPVGRIYSSLIQFIWKDNITDYRSLLKERQVELHVLMVYWAQRAQDVTIKSLGITPNIIKNKTEDDYNDTTLNIREVEVLSWAAIGRTNSEIAETMNVDLSEVTSHIRSALKKLNVSNKTHAISKALYLGLIEI